MENYENIRLPWPEWEITKYLGGGAYGKVYEIERSISGLREKAALKIISRPKDPSEIDSYYENGYDKASIIESYENEIQNYIQEYKLMKELQGQSNIVSCDDFAVVPHENGIGGDIFLRMELLTSLAQVLRERSLSEQETVKLGKDISRALMLCESRNIIHRDIKPANIMVSEFGDYKLGDFGVSKIMDHATYATAMGTPEYQAPEVVHMEKYGKTADIYSLGVTLYWLLNNRKMPFIGADERLTPSIRDEANKQRYRGEQLPSPRDGSRELKRIVLKACAYRPQDRYGSAKEMYQALERLESGQMADRAAELSVDSYTDGSGTDYQSDDGTIGKDSSYAGTAAQQNVGGEECEGGQTAGNSWGASSETIGKPGGNAQKKTGCYSEEDYTKTIGIKQVYQRRQGGASSSKPKAEKAPQSFSQERQTSNVATPSKSKGSAGKIVLCMVVIGIILYVINKGDNSLPAQESSDSVSTDYISKDSALDEDLMNIFNNVPYESFEAACQWLEDNNYNYQDNEYGGKDINGSIAQGKQWDRPISLTGDGRVLYRDCSMPYSDTDAEHKRYVELFNECQKQWDIIFEADQANQCASEDGSAEVCLFEGKDKYIYRLRRAFGGVHLDSLTHFDSNGNGEDEITDVNSISIPWDIISSVDLSSEEQLHTWADVNGFGFINDLSEDRYFHGCIYQPKDIGVTVDEEGDIAFESEPDVRLYYGEDSDKGAIFLSVWQDWGVNNTVDIVKQIVVLLENNCGNKIRAGATTFAFCEYGNKEIYFGVYENGMGCFLEVKEKE